MRLKTFTLVTIPTWKPADKKRDAGVLDTSEDDQEFQPAVSRRNKKKNKKAGSFASSVTGGGAMDQRRASGASFADSESSLLDISRDPSDDVDEDAAVAAAEDDSEDNVSANNATPGMASGNKQEGWSFEAEDDLDVDLLLKSTAENGTSLAADEVDQKGDEDEKTCLDEVFKFDSELAAVRRRGGNQRRGSEDSSEKLVAVSSAKETAAKETDGWNDLDDAFSVDDMAAEDDGEKASLNVKLGSSSSLDQQGLACATSESENETELRQRKGVSGVSSTATGVTTSEGETSSLGNSPNVRKTSKKSKKSKKKRF